MAQTTSPTPDNLLPSGECPLPSISQLSSASQAEVATTTLPSCPTSDSTPVLSATLASCSASDSTPVVLSIPLPSCWGPFPVEIWDIIIRDFGLRTRATLWCTHRYWLARQERDDPRPAYAACPLQGVVRAVQLRDLALLIHYHVRTSFVDNCRLEYYPTDWHRHHGQELAMAVAQNSGELARYALVDAPACLGLRQLPNTLYQCAILRHWRVWDIILQRAPVKNKWPAVREVTIRLAHDLPLLSTAIEHVPQLGRRSIPAWHAALCLLTQGRGILEDEPVREEQQTLRHLLPALHQADCQALYQEFSGIGGVAQCLLIDLLAAGNTRGVKWQKLVIDAFRSGMDVSTLVAPCLGEETRVASPLVIYFPLALTLPHQ
jgi:hypothetical protein